MNNYNLITALRLSAWLKTILLSLSTQ